MADRVLHLGRWKLIYTGRKEVKRRRRREVGKIVGSGEERERESRGIYDGGSAYVSTHYGVHGIKEAAFTTSHIPFTASEIWHLYKSSTTFVATSITREYQPCPPISFLPSKKDVYRSFVWCRTVSTNCEYIIACISCAFSPFFLSFRRSNKKKKGIGRWSRVPSFNRLCIYRLAPLVSYPFEE